MAETGNETTRIQLCGRLSVELDGVRAEDRLRGRQVRLLLAYLVLNRSRPVAREELIEALWPRQAPQSKDAALRTLLSRLRAGIGGEALTGRDELTLTLAEPAWVDLEAAGAELERAQEALRRGDARGAWARAQVPLNIASRGLLAGHQATWLEPPRRELEEIRLAALEVIGLAGLRMGSAQLGSVERSARMLIDAEPYRESGYVLLMDAMAMRGNVAEGLRVFEGLRGLLRDELGTRPSPESLAAHERLLHPRGGTPALTGSPPADTAAAMALPAELRDRAQSPLVGRRAELGELGRRWEAIRDGEGGAAGRRAADRQKIIVLSGDAGVGKTSLAAELAGRVHAEGGVVLAGRSQEEEVAPYQPFLEALHHYFASTRPEALVPAAREYALELSRLIPELRRRLPDPEPAGPADREIERYRLFEAVVALLAGIADQAPILLVLDDLHWAGHPTLLLLRHLARAREPDRLLILIAYRSERADFPVLDTLADLRRDGLVTQLEVGGLSERECAQMIRQRTGQSPSHAMARALHRETQGNPFFIEEIVRNLVGGGVELSEATASDLARFRLPEGVKQVVARRLTRLAPPTIEWLRVAAVIGRSFDARVLEQVLEMAEDEFLASLEESLAAGLLLEEPSTGAPADYSFSHALIREAIYEDMSAPRRARIHRRVGEALEAMGDAPVRALALHFTRAANAENAEKAISYARAAARESTAIVAHEEAAQHLVSALEVSGRFRPQGEERIELLCSLGEALVRAGERPRARQAFGEAARLASRAGNTELFARAAIGASRRYVQQPGVADDELVEMLRRALAACEGEASLTRVRLLSSLVGALSFTPARDRMLELSEEAQRLAEELGDPLAAAYASGARCRALWKPVHLPERITAATEMLSLARQAGEVELELQAHAWLVVALLEAGDREAVNAQVDGFGEQAERLRQPLYLWQSRVWEAMRALLDGSLERAEELADDALASGSPSEAVTAPQYHSIALLLIRREQRRTGEMEETLRRLGGKYPLRTWRAALAVVLADTGRSEQAAEELARGLAEFDAGELGDPDSMVSAALLAEVCIELRDAQSAGVLHELLHGAADVNLVCGVGAACLGPVSRLLGSLAGVRGAQAEAAEHLEAALAAATRLKSPLWLAHVQLDLAAALGDGLRATRLIEDAAGTASQLGLARVANRAERLRHR